MNKILSVDKESQPDYLLHWKPTDMCNYDCSYCSPINHLAIEKNRYNPVEKLILALDKIRQAVPAEKKIVTAITGGEPFLIPDFNLWLERFVFHKMKVTIFTNGSIPARLYEQCKSSLKFNRVCLSFHPESADIDKFVELANLLKDNGTIVEVRGMLVPTLFDKVFELESRLLKSEIVTNKMIVFPLVNTELTVNPPFSSSRSLKGFRQRSDLTLNYYSEEEKRIIRHIDSTQDINLRTDVTVLTPDGIAKTSAVSIIMKDLNKFSGWKCALPSKKLCIQSNGDMQYGVCGNDGVFGNIFTDDVIYLENATTICKTRQCTVPDEITIKKEK